MRLSISSIVSTIVFFVGSALVSGCGPDARMEMPPISEEDVDVQPLAALADLPRSDWMVSFPNDRPVSELIIPGTHDTGAHIINTSDLGDTQDWDVAQQLNNGIRFLDVRIADSGSLSYSFEVMHGSVKLGNFQTSVLTPVTNFLAAHPAEVVFMSIKDEGTLNKSKFSTDVLKASGSRFVLNATPETTLGEVRGKIVLFNRMGTSEGIAWGGSSMNIQNVEMLENNCKAVWWPPFVECSINYSKKAQLVIDQLNAAKADVEYRFWTNFASASYNDMYISNNAAVVNPAVNSWFTDLNQKLANGQAIASFGSIIPMDYPNRPSDDLITTLLRFNQGAVSRGGLMKKLLCSAESSSASKLGGAATTLRFINLSGKAVKLYQITSTGVRQFLSDIATGQTISTNSSVDTSWLILDGNGACMTILKARSAPLLRGYIK